MTRIKLLQSLLWEALTEYPLYVPVTALAHLSYCTSLATTSPKLLIQDLPHCIYGGLHLRRRYQRVPIDKGENRDTSWCNLNCRNAQWSTLWFSLPLMHLILEDAQANIYIDALQPFHRSLVSKLEPDCDHSAVSGGNVSSITRDPCWQGGRLSSTWETPVSAGASSNQQSYIHRFAYARSFHFTAEDFWVTLTVQVPDVRGVGM